MPQGQSDGSVVVDILLDGEKAKQYWENFTSYMNMSTKQLERELVASTKKINELNSAYGEVSAMIKQLRHEKVSINWDDTKSAVLEKAQKNIEDYRRQISSLEMQKGKLINLGASSSGLSLEDWKAQIDSLRQQIENLKQQKKLLDDVEFKLRWQKRSYDDITESIEYLKSVRKELYNQNKEEVQNFQNMNAKYVQLTKETKEQENATKNIEKHTKNIKHNTANIGVNLKSGVSRLASGLKKIVRMSLALIGIQSIYSGITNALRTWMNSEDELAKKTKANLENLKLNFAQMLQPALQWVINAFNNILALVGAVVRKFTSLNIFAKKTAQSTKDMSKSASNTLASFDKIDVLQKDDGTNQDQNIEPINMENLMDKFDGLAEKIKAIAEKIFEPFKNAWDEKGAQIVEDIKKSFDSLKGLGKGIGESVAEVWTNGTVEKSVKSVLDIFDNMIKIIGNIAEAWRKAWADDNTGTKLVQNLADAFNNVLDIIKSVFEFLEKISQSDGYQKFISASLKAVEVISSVVKFITETWQNMISEKSPEWADNFQGIFENFGIIIEKISKALKKITEDEEFQKWYKKFVDVLGDAVTILTDWWKILSDVLVLIVDPSWENLEKLGDDFKDLGEDTGTIVKDVNTLTGALEKAKKGFETLWKVLNVTKYIGNVPLLLAKIIKEIAKNVDWEEVKKNTKKAWEGIKNTVTGTFNTIKEEAPKKIEEAKNKLGKKFEEIAKSVSNKVEETKKNVIDKFGELKTKVPQKIDEAKTEINKKFEDIKTAVKTKVENIRDTVEEKFGELKTKVPDKLQEAKDEIDKKFEDIKTSIKTKVEDIRDTVTDKFEELKTKIPAKLIEVKDEMVKKVEGIRDTVVEKFGELVTKVPEKISNMKEKIWNKFTEIRDNIGTKIAEITEKITSPFAGIGKTIASALFVAYEWGIKPKLNAIIGGVESMINRIIEKLNDFSNTKIAPVLTTGALGAALTILGIKPKYNTNTIPTVYIPRLALGGIATQATPAIIGEAGREAVLPLENNTEWMDDLAERISGNQNFVIKFTGSLSQLAKVLKPEIDKENKRVGRNYIVGGNA